MRNRIKLSDGIEISRETEVGRKRRMISYAERFKGIHRNREKREK